MVSFDELEVGAELNAYSKQQSKIAIYGSCLKINTFVIVDLNQIKNTQAKIQHIIIDW